MDKKANEIVDEEVAESFPASDPPSHTPTSGPTPVGEVRDEIMRYQSQDVVRTYEIRSLGDGCEEVQVNEELNGEVAIIDKHEFRSSDERSAWVEGEKTLVRALGWHEVSPTQP